MYKVKDVKVIPTRDRRFVLAEDFEYKGIIVPKGYKTNGANIPRIFWSIFPPNNPEYLPGSLLHDYLCDVADGTIIDNSFTELYSINKVGEIYISATSRDNFFLYADKKLYELMEQLGCSKIKRKIFYYSVRAYHIFKYKVLKNATK